MSLMRRKKPLPYKRVLKRASRRLRLIRVRLGDEPGTWLDAVRIVIQDIIYSILWNRIRAQCRTRRRDWLEYRWKSWRRILEDCDHSETGK